MKLVQYSWMVLILAAPTFAASGSGSGIGRDPKAAYESAREKAIRSLVERYYNGRGHGHKYEWIRTLITARLRVVIGRDAEVKGQSSSIDDRVRGGTSRKVTVSRSDHELDEMWDIAEAFYDDFGRPTIAVRHFRDEIEDTRHRGHRYFADQFGRKWQTEHGRQRETDSIVEVELVKALEEVGFRVMFLPHADAAAARNADAAVLADGGIEERMLHELQTRYNAQIFLQGSARTMGPRLDKDSTGVEQFSWDAVAKYQAYWTTDGQMASADSAKRAALGFQERDAAIESMRRAGQSLTKRLLPNLFDELSRMAFEGCITTIEVLNCSTKQAVALLRELKQANFKCKLVSVRAKIATLSVTSRMSGINLVSEFNLENLEFNVDFDTIESGVIKLRVSN